MIKITRFEAENIKRVKAVQLEPSENGLTIIGGKNNQGKTSVLDAIAWALGGQKFAPTSPHRKGSVQDPALKATLSNGLIVERKGKNSALKVTDPSGQRSGQKILDSLIGEMALNVPKFMQATSKEKASYLLQVIGVGDELAKLDKAENDAAAERLYVGREGKKKAAYAQSLPHYADAPEEEVSASDLIQRQQAILLKNAENARKRERKAQIEQSIEDLKSRVANLGVQLQEAQDRLTQAHLDLHEAEKDALDLYDESTEALEKDIADVDLLNQKARANKARQAAQTEADALREQYAALSERIQGIREERTALLENAPLPLPDLSVQDGEIRYKGMAWDGMSGSDQLKVSAAICRAINPECGFVLLDKLEQMDSETLKGFGQWLESEGLQAIATRVSTGDECSIIVEDGQIQGHEKDYYKTQDQKGWGELAW